MPVYYCSTTITVEADSPEEALEVTKASMPSSGGVRIAGTVGSVTAVYVGDARAYGDPVKPTHALILDASYIRDEMTDEDSTWHTVAVEAVAAMPDHVLNSTIQDFLGDNFWGYMDETRIEAIDALLDDAQVPTELRRR